MANIKKDGGFMSLPTQFQRTNPIPIDPSLVWYSLNELQTYASSHGAAYVGQILGLVDETNETATAYIITDKAGTLEKIGAAIITDDKSLANENKILSLKNFGKQYYKFVTATETVDSHYELQPVDGSHPWKEGLEPRTTLENNDIVLGWYEPDTTTLDGVNTQVNILQTAVGKLNTDVSTLQNDFTTISAEVSSLKTFTNNLSGSQNELKNEVSNLNQILNDSIDTETNTTTPGLVTVVNNLSNRLDMEFLTSAQIEEKYISKTNFKAVVGDLEVLLNNQVNLYDEIIDINDRLTWQNI